MSTFIYVSNPTTCRIPEPLNETHSRTCTRSTTTRRTSRSPPSPSEMQLTSLGTASRATISACSISTASASTYSLIRSPRILTPVLSHSNDVCVQVVGEAATKQDRCIAFPNLYQHCVSPFQLADPTKPGHRKILALFLVDPHVRISSATDVAPQQELWLRRAVESTALWSRLPSELHEMVWAAMDSITREQAKKYREELMEERREVVKIVDGQRFGRSFSLWCVCAGFVSDCSFLILLLFLANTDSEA